MSDPIYRADLRRTAPYWLKRSQPVPRGRRWSALNNWALLVVLLVVFVAIVPNPVNTIGGIILSGLGILLFGATWIGYLQLARRTSQIIVEEREKGTWETILVAPFAWEDVILAKLAAALRTFYLDMLLWLQGIFVAGFFVVFVFEQGSLTWSSPYFLEGSLVEIILALSPSLVLTLILFTVGRIQDFILLSLIGSIISCLAPNRQIATVVGTFAGIVFLLAAVFLVIVVMSLGVVINPFTQMGEIVAAFVVTGPTGSILAFLPILWALMGAVAVILFREALIRMLFGWLIGHLSEA